MKAIAGFYLAHSLFGLKTSFIPLEMLSFSDLKAIGHKLGYGGAKRQDFFLFDLLRFVLHLLFSVILI